MNLINRVKDHFEDNADNYYAAGVLLLINGVTFYTCLLDTTMFHPDSVEAKGFFLMKQAMVFLSMAANTEAYGRFFGRGPNVQVARPLGRFYLLPSLFRNLVLGALVRD